MDLLKEYGIKEDPRFKKAGKEARLIFLFWIVETIWNFGFALWGNSQAEAAYKVTLGFPTWYFLCVIGIGLIFPIIGIIFTKKLQDCPLDPYGKF